MRYILVDRFLELETGKRARAVKCVTKGEPWLADLPAYPSALVLEGLLQTGGWLTRAATGFTRRCVLGKVEEARFPSEAHAGDRIELEVEAVLSRDEGTLCEGRATVEGREVGCARFMIVYVSPEMTPPDDPGLVEFQRQLIRALRVPLEDA